MAVNLHSTADYHRRELCSLGWETTLCNILDDPRGPCRSLPAVRASYGELLSDFLSCRLPLDKLKHIIEVGGGYGWLMRDFLRQITVDKVTMIDISPILLEVQRKSLRHAPAKIVYREEDFMLTPRHILQEADLIILNENIGDYPTITDLKRDFLCAETCSASPVLYMIRRLFRRYDLPLPQHDPFHLNIGALLALEKICQAGIPYVFLSEHSCEAAVPAPLLNLINISSSGNPECIRLKGHEEFTVRFSYLEHIGRHFGYRVARGPVADYIPFTLKPRIRAILKAPSPWRDEDEAVRYFLEDLYKYEYLLLCKDSIPGGDHVAAVSCRRCGKCCLADFIAYVKEEDLQRWQQEGRQDILSVISHEHAVWAGDHLVSGNDGHYLHGCPFLAWEDDHTICTIYDTRPAVCKKFIPASAAICPQWQP